MRKALNDNPVAQIAVLAVLAVVVAFLLLTRLGGSSSSTPTATAAPDATGSTATTAADTAPPDSTAPATDGAPSPGGPEVGVSSSGFVAGPGLPAAVVNAYRGGDTVVLLVTKHAGIDDRVLRASVRHLRGGAGVAVFTTSAKHIADYARITEGVDVDRAPALVVLRPKHLTAGGSMPEATVSYGFRGTDSVDQAIRDAQYKGNTDLPFYP